MSKQSVLFGKTKASKPAFFKRFPGKAILILFSLFALSVTTSRAQDYYTDDQASVTVQAQTAPPPIPDYVQPACPGDGYYWVPGYWAWGSGGYYWVPGVWVLPPSAGLLWTPGYWAFYGGFYGWHPGYWGATVGYYGGINYGFGYFGTGFYGGRWEGGHFMYNTAVWRVGRGIHNTYVNRVNITNNNHVSFNGRGGVNYRPTEGERGAMQQNRTPAHQLQVQHEQNMMNERGQFHAPNQAPAVHSMSMPGGERFDQRGRSMGMGGHGGGGGGGRGRRG
ncbi:YXWGXW repeat-containing protein [Chitinophaga dinghuensis]|uniref:YXWGXW repeat-containing protein n=1 Tax=Chitinophaga dinghuensis TaxID=1539050 RepID=A0A327VYN7_9BACT|nr:YXWGXW repeat-containing protein [Chitinophaga dinghuensis]RAJ80056.1 YXWGXW repeat-containing protein [Chitinophaga dinghuensis]